MCRHMGCNNFVSGALPGNVLFPFTIKGIVFSEEPKKYIGQTSTRSFNYSQPTISILSHRPSSRLRTPPIQEVRLA